MMTMQVGKKYLRENGKKHTFGYRNVRYHPGGWADAKQFYPTNYDLLYLKTNKEGIKAGWKSPHGWDGLKIEAGEEVLFWKRNIEDHGM